MKKSLNPAPLGLFGFALTTILLNIHNAGIFELNAMILSMGIFYGGIAQIIAGILESKKGNTFATTAFISYGSFWLSLVAIWLMSSLEIYTAPTSTAMGYYLLMWGLFTLVLFFATLKSSLITKLVFFSLFILFMLLAIANFTGNDTIHMIAGIEGILTGCLAFYDGAAQLINESYGRTILPLGMKK